MQTAAAVQAFLGTSHLNARILRAQVSADGIKQEWYVAGNIDAPGEVGWVQTYAADTAAVQAGVILQKLRRDAYVAVPGTSNFPLQLRGVDGVGRVSLNYDSAVDAFIAKNASIYNSTACTVGTGGTDSTSGGNTFFATPSYAVRTWAGGSVVNILNDITFDPFDLRSTDASQASGLLLKVMKGNGFNALARTAAAVDPATATYTADVTNTNCWGTPAAWVTGSFQVTRMLRQDQTDTYGYSKQLKLYASLALLNAASEDGWYWDNTAKQLWLNMGGNVNSIKSALKAMWVGAAATSRFQCLGGAFAMDGIYMEGVQTVHNDAASRRNSFALHNCRMLWPTAKGWDGTTAGDFIATNLRMHASRQDGVNGSAPGNTGEGLIQLANSTITNAGDFNVFPADGTIQAVSAHGGTDHTSFGCTYIGSNGQGIADTAIASHSNVTWIVASTIGPQLNTSADNIQAGGTGGSRKMYLDSVISTKAGTNDLRIDSFATVYTHATVLPVVAGGTVVPYTPNNPL